MNHLLRQTFGLGLLLGVLGCNSSPSEVLVTGNVSYQGTPVQTGEIVFADAVGSAPSSYSPIKDGKYELRTMPGAKQVRIVAKRETGKVLEGAMGAQIPETVDLIPAQYNTNTTLTARVAEGKNPPIDFTLE